jgi:hypothetical protein
LEPNEKRISRRLEFIILRVGSGLSSCGGDLLSIELLLLSFFFLLLLLL